MKIRRKLFLSKVLNKLFCYFLSMLSEWIRKYFALFTNKLENNIEFANFIDSLFCSSDNTNRGQKTFFFKIWIEVRKLFQNRKNLVFNSVFRVEIIFIEVRVERERLKTIINDIFYCLDIFSPLNRSNFCRAVSVSVE